MALMNLSALIKMSRLMANVRDVAGPADAVEVYSMMLKVDDTDELFCLEQADVGQVVDPDESIRFDYDVKIDG